MCAYIFVWDFDGVIANTPHEEAWREACKLYGIDGFDHEFYMKYVSGLPRVKGGMNILEKLNYFSRVGIINENDKEIVVRKFTDLKTEIYLRLIDAGHYSLNRGVIEFILKSRSIGIFQVLASASKNVLRIALREKISPYLRLVDIFDANVSGGGSTKEEVFRRAMSVSYAKFSDVKCIVFFEDSPQGVQAAKSLGGIVVGCFNEELKKYGADFIVNNFALLMPQDLLRVIGCE